MPPSRLGFLPRRWRMHRSPWLERREGRYRRMSVDIRVPALGESVIEATVGRWLKRGDESIQAGEPLVELETDKVNVEVPAEQSGVLQKITATEGANVRVGDVIATLEAGGVEESAIGSHTPSIVGGGGAPALVESAPPIESNGASATPVAKK